MTWNFADFLVHEELISVTAKKKQCDRLWQKFLKTHFNDRVTWKPWGRSSGRRWRLGEATVGEGCSARWSRAWQEADAPCWARCPVLYSEKSMVTILFSARNGTTYWTTGRSAPCPASGGVFQHLPHPCPPTRRTSATTVPSLIVPQNSRPAGDFDGGSKALHTVYCLWRTVWWLSVSNNLMVWFLIAPYLWNIETTLHCR